MEDEEMFEAEVPGLAIMGLTKVYAAGATYAEARHRIVARLAGPAHPYLGIEGAKRTGEREFAFFMEGLIGTGCKCHAKTTAYFA
jgi:hypothetical protein